MDKAPKDPLFLYSDDLVKNGEWRAPEVTIEKVFPANTISGADRRQVDKPCVKFVGSDKMLVVNTTNQTLLRLQFGTSVQSEWVGKKVTLQPRVIAEAFGEQDVPVIRIKLPTEIPVPFRLRRHMGKELKGAVTKN